jgi:hypothetical protein
MGRKVTIFVMELERLKYDSVSKKVHSSTISGLAGV